MPIGISGVGAIAPKIWGPGGIGAIGSFTDEYQAVYDSLTTPPSSAVATLQNTMVEAMVAGGIWTKRDVVYIFAQSTNDDSEALRNWKNPGTNDATLVNAPTFSVYEGFTTNGSTNYINTNYNPVDDGSNFLAASASISFYELDNVLANGVAVGSYGSTSSDNACFLNINGAGSLNGKLYEGVAIPAFTTSDSRGLNTVSRTASNKIEVLWNGVSKDTVTQAQSGAILNDIDMFIGGASDDGVLHNPTARQFAMVSIGGGLTEAEVLIEYNAIKAYMDALDALFFLVETARGETIDEAKWTVVNDDSSSLSIYQDDGLKIERIRSGAAANYLDNSIVSVQSFTTGVIKFTALAMNNLVDISSSYVLFGLINDLNNIIEFKHRTLYANNIGCTIKKTGESDIELGGINKWLVNIKVVVTTNTISVYYWSNDSWTQLGSPQNINIGEFNIFMASRGGNVGVIALKDIYVTNTNFNTLNP